MVTYKQNLRLFIALASIFFVANSFAQSFVDYIDQGIPVDKYGRYANHDQHLSRASTAVHLSFLARRFGTAFRDYTDLPKKQLNNGHWLRDNTEQASVTWVGHSTLLVQMQGINFLTDPIWSKPQAPYLL